MRLGGSPSILDDDFPDKPKGMHWRTYERLCRLYEAAEDRSTVGSKVRGTAWSPDLKGAWKMKRGDLPQRSELLPCAQPLEKFRSPAARGRISLPDKRAAQPATLKVEGEAQCPAPISPACRARPKRTMRGRAAW